MLKNIFFDLDGTLSDPFEGVAKGIQFAMSQMERDIPNVEFLKTCIGPPLHDSFAELLSVEGSDPKVVQAVEFYREYYKEKGLYENVLYNGVRAPLERLSKEYTLFVATSKPQPFAKHVIEHFELDSYFVEVHGSELNGDRADKTELLKYILEKHDLKASETVMVGDRKFDALGAIANDVDILGVLWGYGSESEFMENGVDNWISTTDDLLGAISSVKVSKE